MFGFIKRRLERIKRKRILNDIIKAKQHLMNRDESFMCLCFAQVNYSKYRNYDMIRKRIPEFNREFCEAKFFKGSVWWDRGDKEPRIKAFDKLIEIYSK